MYPPKRMAEGGATSARRYALWQRSAGSNEVLKEPVCKQIEACENSAKSIACEGLDCKNCFQDCFCAQGRLCVQEPAHLETAFSPMR